MATKKITTRKQNNKVSTNRTHTQKTTESTVYPEELIKQVAKSIQKDSEFKRKLVERMMKDKKHREVIIKEVVDELFD